MEFIYKGESEIGQKYLANLMSVSEDLQVTGILEAFVAEQDQSSKKQYVETESRNLADMLSSQEKNKSDEMAIKHESMKTQASGNLLLGNIKVEAFDDHANINVLQSDPLLQQQIHTKTKNTKVNRYNRLTKCPKPLNEYIRKEVDLKGNADSVDADTDMVGIPEFWKYVGKCSFNYRMKFGTETYSKCLVCSKKIGNDNKNLARHWRRFHLEKKVASSGTDSIYSVESQNIQKGTNDNLGNEIKNSSKTTLYQRTKNSGAENHIPKYWDEFNGKSWKDGDKYKCNICGSSINSKSNTLEKHWKRYHSEAPEDQVIIVNEGENPDDVIASLMEIKFARNGGVRATCKICGLKQCKSDLVRHIDSNHISGAKYKCGDCSKVLKHKKSHEVHLRTCIEKIANKVPRRVTVQLADFDFQQKMKSMIGRNEIEYICKVCGVTKTSNTGIHTHVESSHMEVDHPCKFCESGVSYKTQKSLNNHINRHHK